MKIHNIYNIQLNKTQAITLATILSIIFLFYSLLILGIENNAFKVAYGFLLIILYSNILSIIFTDVYAEKK